MLGIAPHDWRGGKSASQPLAPGLPPGMPDRPIDFGPVRLLSAAPPIFLSGIPYNGYLGIADAFAERYGNIRAGFVIFPTWSIESPGFPQAIRRKFLRHLKRYPHHTIRFICNTRKEAELLEEVGLPAVFLNKNFMVSDRIFRPLQHANVEFDGVYNARFVPEKRHELAATVPRVSYIAYMERTFDGRHERERQEQFRRLCAVTLARSPGHALLNRVDIDGLPTVMSHEQVNAGLDRATVGLILSEEGGSSSASIEYLLAGLPVVSTPSKGGRDVFFDPEYCIVCEPNPAAVRDAVAALRARNIPKEVVRARTLAKIQPERERFLAIVDDLIEERGGKGRYSTGAWPFGDTSGVTWRRFEEHLAEFAENQPGGRVIKKRASISWT
jgi:glycosyltransferase involved in cell wall biosynthesis